MDHPQPVWNALSAYTRTQMALRLEATIAERAKANVKHGTGSCISGRQKSDNPIDTKHEIATLAGVSQDIAQAVAVQISRRKKQT